MSVRRGRNRSPHLVLLDVRGTCATIGLVPHDPLTDADPAVGVGSVHHIVPRFYLRRFADERDQITVVSRITGQRRDAPVDKAHRQKDFYTFVNTDGESDGRVEQLLGLVEGQAATALRNTFHPVFGRWPPMGEHRLELIQFVAFQSLRGRRQRRQMEMIADPGACPRSGSRWKVRATPATRGLPHSGRRPPTPGGRPRESSASLTTVVSSQARRRRKSLVVLTRRLHPATAIE